MVNGEIHGHGIYTYGHGSLEGSHNRYNGEWDKGRWHGRGEYISADGFSIDGLWESNNLVGIRTSSEDNISSEIKNRVNTVKKTNNYFLDPLLSNFGLTRKEVLDKNGTPGTIVPYYSGFYSFGGGPIDYYCYNKLNACFMLNDKYPITVWFYGHINDSYPSWAEIEFSIEARNFIFDW